MYFEGAKRLNGGIAVKSDWWSDNKGRCCQQNAEDDEGVVDQSIVDRRSRRTATNPKIVPPLSFTNIARIRLIDTLNILII